MTSCDLSIKRTTLIKNKRTEIITKINNLNDKLTHTTTKLNRKLNFLNSKLYKFNNTLSNTESKVFGIWLRNDSNYCDWSTKIDDIIKGNPEPNSIILILGNYITAASTRVTCGTGVPCNDTSTFNTLILNAKEKIIELKTKGVLKEIWLNINGFANNYEKCFKTILKTNVLQDYNSIRNNLYNLVDIPFKISWDLEGPGDMGDPTDRKDSNVLGFPGDKRTLHYLVDQLYNTEGTLPPNGNVLTLGGDQSYWYGTKDDPNGSSVIQKFTNILNRNYTNNKITDLVPMLYNNSRNVDVVTSNELIANWKKTMENDLNIKNINYYFSAMVNDNNTCKDEFKPILDNLSKVNITKGLLVWDSGINNNNLSNVVNSYYNNISLPECPVYDRIYFKNNDNKWVYNIFWTIIKGQYTNLSTLLDKYYIYTDDYTQKNLNLWRFTNPLFNTDNSSVNNIKIPISTLAVPAATTLQFNNIVSYANSQKINQQNTSNIYFVKGTDIDTFNKTNNITPDNSSSTDPNLVDSYKLYNTN
jgi:hypothetical protein